MAFVTLGIRYLLTTNIDAHIPMIFKNRVRAISRHPLPHHIFCSAPSSIKSIITMISCIISIHMDNLPNVLSVFHISSNNFRITMVLLNADHIHIYHAVIGSIHMSNEIPNQSAAVIMT